MRLILILLFCFSCSQTFAQGFIADTFSVEDEIKKSIELYDRFTGAQQPIYNGSEYVPFTFQKTGDPFFDTSRLTNADIGYAGRVYHSIPMQYDIVRNQLVILNYDRTSEINLQNELVDSFHFLNHLFIRVKEDPKQNLEKTDFYEFLFNGHIQVLARRRKELNDLFKDNEILRVFYEKDVFYIHKGDKYYVVSNKKNVFNIFKDKRRELKSLMRQQKIKFRKKNFGEGLLATTRIYAQLPD